MKIYWELNPQRLADVASFFCNIVRSVPEYISAGEIKAGLSLDGLKWVDDLQTRYKSEMFEITRSPEARSVAVSRSSSDDLLGAAVVSWEPADHGRNAVLEDLGVVEHAREHGIGTGLIEFIELEAAKKGYTWLLLETGPKNVVAQKLFRRRSYRHLSNVYGKSLVDVQLNTKRTGISK